MEIQRRNGVPIQQEVTPVETWPLHLKETTLLDPTALFALPTSTTRSKEFLERVWWYLTPACFDSLATSRTIKPTALPLGDITSAIANGKFELSPSQRLPLEHGYHSVSVFTVPELKRRRRLITEPILNKVIAKHEVPKVAYPTRLGRRQALRYAKYMLQIDFEAFYDSIPLPENVRNNFVFLAKDRQLYRLKTLPTGARWSVAVGQAITTTITDIDTGVAIQSLIDNILVSAQHGQEREFVRTVRALLTRIKAVNLLTSPCRDELLQMSDDELLTLSRSANVFLGEEYCEWDDEIGERLVRNSVKTVAKLHLAAQITDHTHRTFVSLVSLILYALHTTQLNPARTFRLLMAYRGVYRQVTRNHDWDEPLVFLSEGVKKDIAEVTAQLVENQWWRIAPYVHPTYDDRAYDKRCFTDASASGWGALVQDMNTYGVDAFQQRWIHDLVGARPNQAGPQTLFFNARRSAHAEPRACQLLIKQLLREGIPDQCRLAVVTDHYPIVLAQRRLNGYGGIGRGFALNKLYELVHDLRTQRGILVDFFYIAGPCNPADELSRNFGEDTEQGNVLARRCVATVLPPLSQTYSNLCD